MLGLCFWGTSITILVCFGDWICRDCPLSFQNNKSHTPVLKVLKMVSHVISPTFSTPMIAYLPFHQTHIAKTTPPSIQPPSFNPRATYKPKPSHPLNPKTQNPPPVQHPHPLPAYRNLPSTTPPSISQRPTSSFHLVSRPFYLHSTSPHETQKTSPSSPQTLFAISKLLPPNRPWNCTPNLFSNNIAGETVDIQLALPSIEVSGIGHACLYVFCE